MNRKKIKKLSDFKLTIGQHKNIAQGAYMMELVSYIADEPWSDHPKCACPILTECANIFRFGYDSSNDRRDKVAISAVETLRLACETM